MELNRLLFICLSHFGVKCEFPVVNFIDFCQVGQRFVELVCPFRKKGKLLYQVISFVSQLSVEKNHSTLTSRSYKMWIPEFKPRGSGHCDLQLVAKPGNKKQFPSSFGCLGLSTKQPQGIVPVSRTPSGTPGGCFPITEGLQQGRN